MSIAITVLHKQQSCVEVDDQQESQMKVEVLYRGFVPGLSIYSGLEESASWNRSEAH